MCAALTLPDDGNEPKTFAEMQARHLAARRRLWMMGKPKPIQATPAPEPELPEPPKKLPAVPVIQKPLSLYVPVETIMVANVKPTIKEIIQATSDFFRIPLIVMLGPSRMADCVIARQLICYIARTMCGKSFPEIGRMMGHRDHSTIIHAYRRARDEIARDDAFTIASIEQIKRLLPMRRFPRPVAACVEGTNDNRVGASPTVEVSEAPSLVTRL